MTNISLAGVPAMIGGASQQPENARLETQCSEQINCYASPVTGCIKRHPTRHIAELVTGDAGDAFIHLIDRDPTERYVAIFRDEDVTVFGLDGTEYPVHDIVTPYTPDFSYLSGDPSRFRALTVIDYTFVVNADTVVALGSTVTARDYTEQARGFIVVRQAGIAVEYTVTVSVDGTPADYNTRTWQGPPGPPAAGEVEANTDLIAAELASQLNGHADITAYSEGSVVMLDVDGVLDSITTKDGLGDGAMVSFIEEIVDFDDLPTTCQDGHKVEVTGVADASVDNYWAEFVAEDDGAFSKGKWIESNGWDVTVDFDPATMPHTLRRFQDDISGTVTGTPYALYFVWGPADWEDLEVGDAETNSDPSFVGQTIENVFFFQNRLGFLSQDSVILSEAGRYFNFWRTTIRDVTDSESIDSTAGHNKVSKLYQAVPQDRLLYLFSDRTIFEAGGDPRVTPSTFYILPALEFENYSHVVPEASSTGVFFCFKRGQFSGLRELVRVSDERREANEITVQVPRYISGTAQGLTASTLEDVLVVRSDGDEGSLWVNQHYTVGSEKIQNAWGRWDLGPVQIRHAGFIENELYLIVQRAEGLFLEAMVIGTDVKDADSTYSVRLDRKIPDTHSGVTATYSSGTDSTTIDLPYDMEDGQEYLVVSRADGSEEAGRIYQTLSTDTEVSGLHSITVSGDLSSSAFWVGERYTQTYEFTQPQLREQSGRGQATVTSGRFQVLRGRILFSDSGHFQVTVSAPGKADSVHTWNAQLLASGNFVLGELTLEDGVFSFPVFSKADQCTITVTNASPMPANLQSAEWEARFRSRSTRYRG